MGGSQHPQTAIRPVEAAEVDAMGVLLPRLLQVFDGLEILSAKQAARPHPPRLQAEDLRLRHVKLDAPSVIAAAAALSAPQRMAHPFR